MRATLRQKTPWLLFTLVVIVPLVAWLNTYQWAPPITALTVFPLLGVWAWGIMWTHYILGWLRLRMPERFERDELYGKYTAWLVLALILLHPSLLAGQQYQRFGMLPPESYTSYVASSMELFVYFGIVGLFVFLSYEIFLRLKHKLWLRKIWGWVGLTQIAAMLLIFVHGFAIGDSVLYGWINIYWLLLGVLLLPAGIEVVRNDFRQQRAARDHYKRTDQKGLST